MSDQPTLLRVKKNYTKTVSILVARLVRLGLLSVPTADASICTKHGRDEHPGATSCVGDGSFEWWRDCNMVDVVRLEVPA